MPFPEKDYYKIIMEIENDDANTSNSLLGNNYNNNADIAAGTGLYGYNNFNYNINNAGPSIFGYNQYNTDDAKAQGIGLFANYYNNKANISGPGLFSNNVISSLIGNYTGKSLFGNSA